MTRKSAARFIAIIIIGFSLCSCTAGGHRMYSGQLLPRSAVAIIANASQSSSVVKYHPGACVELGDFAIQAVDGNYLKGDRIVELLPGRHVVQLSYSPAGYAATWMDYAIQAEAGHTYAAYETGTVDSLGQFSGKWRPQVDDITNQLSDTKWHCVKSGIEEYWTTQRATE
jgi:hypothetical protein